MIKLTTLPPAAQPRTTATVGRIVLTPNCSLSWRATKRFLALFMTLSLAIAITFTLQGLWLVLPFSILEVTAVCACFYYLARRARYQEVIEFTADSVRVTRGHRVAEQSIQWPRFFTRIVVQQPRYQGHQTTIALQHRNQTVELGSCLNREEKSALVKHLQSLVQLADQRQINTA